ncbi:MAG TPA: PIG-L family deacetylase [Ardenticatenaceae bacterium]|nr:PIG-L family deacetylase [Ardenticatenaceae bacterium]
MNDQLSLMCTVAHPDDESFGFGGTLVRYATEGVATHVVCATRGPFGWPGAPAEHPGHEALAALREGELREAAAVLGLTGLHVLDFLDSHLAKVSPPELEEQLVALIRRVRPQVIVTFGPDGMYGHPDHITMCQATTAAVAAAADPTRHPHHLGLELAPHRVSKLYYIALTHEQARLSDEAYGTVTVHVDGVRNEFDFVGYDNWYVTARLDVAAFLDRRWEASIRHRSQLPGMQAVGTLSQEQKLALWGEECYYRALTFVDSGPGVESDLFAGLR